HYNLGSALQGKGQVDKAIHCLKQAIELDPMDAEFHTNLGSALQGKGQWDEAIASYRKAIELDPKLALAHNNLGNALAGKAQWDEAIECWKKAIKLDPKLTLAHYNLGNALQDKGQLDEAITAYRKATEIDPNFAEAHCNLGHALARQGRFAESLAALRRGHELGTKQPGWPYPSAAWVRQAEANAALEAKLPAFLKGAFRPGDTKERLGLAGVCQGKKLHHQAAGLYAAAFAADPRLAADFEGELPHAAAGNAALAAAGVGEDAAQLDDRERVRLRQQALDWLRADLALRTRQLESDKPAERAWAQEVLHERQQDADLASVRDAAA